MNIKKANIVYFSASGNTKKAAQWLGENLTGRGIETGLHEIFRVRKELPEELFKGDILFIGTPTYMWHTPDIVEEFISAFPDINNMPVGLFVTYGSVTIGSNLSSMKKLIENKKGRVVGGMKIEGEHAMMFKSDSPLAKGKPSVDERPLVDEFAEKCLDRAAGRDSSPCNMTGVMKYFSFMAPPSVLKNFMPGIKLDREKCTFCGKCVEACPVENITAGDTTVSHGNECLLCYNCVRV